MGRRRKYELSFSWRQATGYSAAKGRISRKIGIPLTRSGRQRKVGRALGSLLPTAISLSALLLIAFVFAAFAVSGQDKLPDYGNIVDLKDMTKVYVATDATDARKFILDELKKYKTLEVVASPDEGQFVLECKQTGHITVVANGSLIKEMPTFGMVAYTLKDGRHRVAWSETKTSLSPAATILTRDFIKALKKARGEKN